MCKMLIHVDYKFIYVYYRYTHKYSLEIQFGANVLACLSITEEKYTG